MKNRYEEAKINVIKCYKYYSDSIAKDFKTHEYVIDYRIKPHMDI